MLSEDNFEGLGIFLDTYANSRHQYAFPRVVGMLGDGKTEYDAANDGEAHQLGACSVSPTVSKPDLRMFA